MASESRTDDQRENATTGVAPSGPPPRLPPPTGLQLPPTQFSHGQPWSLSSSQRSLQPTPTIIASGMHEAGQQVQRPFRLPPLDTFQVSHRSVTNNQLSFIGSEQYPSKRRRVEVPKGGGSPDLVSRSELSADSSIRLTHAAHRQDQLHGTSLSAAEPHSDTLNYATGASEVTPAWESHAKLASHDTTCCSPGCQGSSCARLRSIVQDLVTEICARDPHVFGANSATEFPPPKLIQPEATEIDTSDALEWALQRLRWNNASLKTLLRIPRAATEPPTPLDQQGSPHHISQERMKRQHEAVDKDIEATSQHQSRQFQAAAEQSSQTTPLVSEPWRPFEGMDPPGQPPSRHYRSSSFSYGPPPPSSSASAQAARMLPSPSSLNLPIPPSLPSISSPSPASASSAHLAHLQDLQHQVSVKQLALQTLQREYDSLLQKLERQRTRSQTLEKKFEISDAEINSLTDEKERLAGLVQSLESQLEELQVARDEARKMGADSAAQYMKIVEMAGRLQGKGVEDKKAWEKERDTLLRRIAELEGGQPPPSSGGSHAGSSAQSPVRLGQTASPMRQLSEQVAEVQTSRVVLPNPVMSSDTTVLQQEVLELKHRIAKLEKALKEALDESKAVRQAALTLASVGQRIEVSAASALGRSAQSDQQ